MFYDVFIPTAGIGSRLYDLSKNLNKSLLPINYKPIISHIIEKFPDAKIYHIAIGFKGKLVRDYLEIAYPKKKFNFIKIKNYSGKGSGLGLTMLHSVKYLNRPFYFISCDTFINNQIKFKNFNWLGYSDKKDLSNSYRYLRIKKKNVFKILEKKEIKNSKDKIYIGLAFIKDIFEFKKNFKENKKNILKIGEVAILRAMIEKKIKFKAIKIDWHDTGNLKDYYKLKKIQDKKNINILDKPNEAIWFSDKKVIKFSSDKNFIKNRILRTKYLKNYVPKITNTRDNFYTYRYVNGKLFSNIKDLKKFENLLNSSKIFWKKKKLKIKAHKNFLKDCETFYKKKTIERVKQFYTETNINDKEFIINAQKVEKFSDLIQKIDWKFVSKGIPSRFHGDFHFENIIFNETEKKFTFLDWRQDFNNNLIYGDIYYDLAKLMHGIIVSHEIVLKKNFLIKIKKKNITVNIKRKKHLIKFENYFCNWILLNNLSLKKVYLITSLIYLNIAVLHHDPYNKFLYFFGLYMLNKFLELSDETK